MDGHYIIYILLSTLYAIPIIAVIIGSIALPIAGLVLRKSKKELSKKLLIAGGLCFGIFCCVLLNSILASL